MLESLKVKFKSEIQRYSMAGEPIVRYLLEWCLYQPIQCMGRLTIPESDHKKWHKSFSTVQPVCCYFAFLLFTNGKKLYL